MISMMDVQDIKGLVTVIIPVHNRPDLLVEAVESVWHQDYSLVEVIIVDDASTDSTPKVASALVKRWPERMRLLHQDHCQGPGVARQRALEQAQGEFIQYLDSDDLLLPGKFQAQVAALGSNPLADICYGRSYQEMHSSDSSVSYTGPIRATGEELTSLFPLLLRERWWTTSSPLYRHSLCRRIGPWLPLINEEDWEYDARAGAHGAVLVAVAHDVSVRRMGLSEDHLSLGAERDLQKLSHKAKARLAIHSHALRAGESMRTPEMVPCYRAALVLSRQCALAGLAVEAKDLFNLANNHQKSSLIRALAMQAYSALASCIGWRNAAQFAEVITRFSRSLWRGWRS